MITSLNLLAPFTILASGIIIGGIITANGYMISDLSDGNTSGEFYNFGDWRNLPIFVSLTLFSFENTGMVFKIHLRR